MADSSRDLLDAVYSGLGYSDGELLVAADAPSNGNLKAWLEKGDWLSLAKKVGAEKVFFVDNNPVIVFAEQVTANPSEWLQWFNSVWCMARPQLLFLARKGELVVLNLTKPPVRHGEVNIRHDRLLQTIETAAEVQEKLANYRRERVESGLLFEEERFGANDRADKALIRDLGKVRRALIDDDLAPVYAHALIGRSIFIRYLEDRGVLTEAYFRQIADAGDKEKWNEILDADIGSELAVDEGRTIFYTRILSSKAFTYALFRTLSQDFNGDMFPMDDEEQRAVEKRHLNLLRKLLLGTATDGLFFYAYRFDVIPIELISSIYEKFYSAKPNQQRDVGSYYTPASLVEFVLSQTLDEAILARNPRIMDPACGSGIFLVEAFRRIIRFRIRKAGGIPEQTELREMLRSILRDQIRGMDINKEAIRVAAFSLYLAMLHYLKPPDILQHKQLPSLTYAIREKTDPELHFDILLVSDAFRVEEKVPPGPIRDRFASSCAEIVIGNPPWGTSKGSVPAEIRSDGGVRWCKKRKLAVGDRERSQSFIHRTMDILTDGGRGGLLASTGIFFKRHENSKLFREQWLSCATLRNVVNFAAVRNAFFQIEGAEDEGRGAIAPFGAVIFDKILPKADSFFGYWSAKETAFVKLVQAVILNRADFSYAKQDDYLKDETLWKVYWWGSHRDESLVKRLRLENTLGRICDPTNNRLQSGFKEGNHENASGWLRKLMEFPARRFHRYGILPSGEFLRPPKRVERRRVKALYHRARLLIKRGINNDEVAEGRIIARYETARFCFRHSIYSLSLTRENAANAKIILGILWSSVTRYFVFMTSGAWGLWHDEVLKETLKNVPIRIPKDNAVRTRIENVVDLLRELPAGVQERGLFDEGALTKTERLERIRHLEAELDNAVFDLFEFSEEERSKVNELCRLGLNFFYRGMESTAVEPLVWPADVARYGRSRDLIDCREDCELGEYLRTYLEVWEPHLKEQSGALRWRIIQAFSASPMMAVVFQTEAINEELPTPDTSDEQEWQGAVEKVKLHSWQTAGADRIIIDGLMRVVSDTDMVIIKRNQRRLWTPSSARDDAEATMLLAMQLSERLENTGK